MAGNAAIFRTSGRLWQKFISLVTRPQKLGHPSSQLTSKSINLKTRSHNQKIIKIVILYSELYHVITQPTKYLILCNSYFFIFLHYFRKLCEFSSIYSCMILQVLTVWLF